MQIDSKRFVVVTHVAIAALLVGCATEGTSNRQLSSSNPSEQGAFRSEVGVFIRPATGHTLAGFDGNRNKGLDIAGNLGDPVVAAADGRVVSVTNAVRGYGTLVIVKHDDTYLTAYAHLDHALVRQDETVRQGQRIGSMGMTDTDRVKLHFEVRRKGVAVDPSSYLRADSSPPTPRTSLPPAPVRPDAAPPPRVSAPPANGGVAGGVTSIGSAFSVSPSFIITNAHVVEKCAGVLAGGRRNVKVRAIDKASDLALLEAEALPGAASIRLGRIRQGEPVTVIGYPHAGVLANGPQVTSGNVTALAGPNNSADRIQISAPVQPGNSGGPALDESGNVIGVVVSKLGLKFAAMTGDLPQNINFAVSLSALRKFLDANKVPYKSAGLGKSRSTADIADMTKPFTTIIGCTR